MRAASLPALVAAALLVVGGMTAGAQDRSRAAGEDARPSANAAPSPLRGDASRLRPGAYTYDVVVTGDSATMVVGTHRVEVQDGSFAGAPAWMIVEHRESVDPFVRVVAVDTVLLGREALAPRRWDAHAGDARLVAAFADDSVYGGASAPQARRTFTLPAPPALMTSEGALDAMLRTVAFHPGWSAAATMLVADLDGGRLVPVTLAMAYETVVELPVGSFDAWVIHVGVAGTDRWIWIDKRTQVVLKTETRSPHMPGMLVERVVTRAPS